MSATATTPQLTFVSRPRFKSVVELRTHMVRGDLPVTFVGYPTNELVAMEEQARKQKLNPDSEVLRRVVCELPAVRLPDGGLLNEEGGLDKLLDYQGVARAMLRKYYDDLWEERLGNSEAQLDGSTATTAAPEPTMQQSESKNCAA